MAPRRLARAESAARTRERLLRAGRKVFLERGYHASTLEAVAREAGFTTGAVYSAFAGKADLFFEVLEEHNAGVLADVSRGLESERTLAGLQRSGARWWTRRLREGPEWSLLLVEFWASACREPALRRRFSERHERFIAQLAGALDQRIAAITGRTGGRSLGALDFIRTTSALGHGIALERMLSPDAFADEVIERAFASLPYAADRRAADATREEG